MDFSEYQERTADTDVGTSAQDKLRPGWMYYVLGVGGEAGELLEKIKKLFRDSNGQITVKFQKMVIKEVGDILWYLARLCTHLGIDFNEVAETNLSKLKSRMERDKIHGDGDER
jgi:NTP pyrophosphatase (non-canonical NTP hydrolase)